MKNYFELEKLRQKAQSEGKCTNCYRHKANNIPYVGDGGIMGYIHGAYTFWCDCCVLKAQIKHEKEQSKMLKGNLKKLKKLKCL